MAAFTWTPSYEVHAETAPRVRVARFGDGYEQRVADGINAQPRAWELRFDYRDAAEADAIDAFLSARGASESFDWTPAWGTAVKVVCRSWRRTLSLGNWHSVSARFEQVYE